MRLTSLFISAALLFSCMASIAKETPVKDLDQRTVFFHEDYTANEDFTFVEVQSLAIQILNKRAVENAKSRSISYSKSVETIEILEAYNLKSNGNKLAVPKDNYQIRTNSGRESNGPVFSDRATITTVFPEVEVGDTLVLSYKRTVSEPMFPEYFTAANSFSTAHAYDDVTINLTVPKSFKGKYKSRNMAETIVDAGDRVKYTWRWTNSEPIIDYRKDYSVRDLDSETGFSYSTFDSYQAIAEAYGVRALPKAKVTDRVSELADRIVGNIAGKRQQAQLLYEWVATNITYAGNCVGVGAVVPHDISFILDNHMGDCKDHATLLQALLEAKDIDSVQALVNSGNIYSLPGIPAVNSVNHVINYLPDFDLFVDSTSDSTPFGMLPTSVQGKPVLLVKNFAAGKKTPISKPGADAQTLTSEIKVQPDGSIKGFAHIVLQGEPAVTARSNWRRTSKDSEEQWLKSLFTNNGQNGSASIVKDDPKPLLGKYNYTMHFEQKEFLLSDSAGAFSVYAPTPSYLPIYQLAWVPEQLEEHPIACSGGESIEHFTYEFPENFKLLDFPKSKVIKGGNLHYEANYKLTGNVLHVKRALLDSTPGPTCSPEYMSEQREILKKIFRNLRAQIVYKPLTEDD